MNLPPLLVMKRVLLLCSVLVTLVSCQKEDLVKAEAAPYPQTWKLVKTTGQLPGSTRTGADMVFQETYVFQADGTFVKKRQQGNQALEARGTFSVQHLSDGPYAVLAYAAANPIIGSCTQTTWIETLIIKTDDTMVSTWQACDGPGLEYQKVK